MDVIKLNVIIRPAVIATSVFGMKNMPIIPKESLTMASYVNVQTRY